MVAALTPRRIVLAGVVLALAWLAGAARGAVLYDGLPLSNEPYRYLHPPAGTAPAPAPTGAERQLPVNAGRSQAFELDTAETGPQVQWLAADAALGAPAGATTIDIRVDPVDPPLTAPTGSFDGNVYRISANVAGQPVDLVDGASCSVTLRGTGAQGTPLFEELSGGHWTQLRTVEAGNPGFYTANIARLGDVALVFAGPSASSTAPGSAVASPSSGSGFPIAPVIIVGVVLTVVGFAGSIRLRRRTEVDRARRMRRGQRGRRR